MRKPIDQRTAGNRGCPALRLSAVLAIVLMIATGCLTPATIVPTRFYTLAPEAAPIRSAEPSPLTLGIRPILAVRPYGLQMAVLEADGRISYMEKLEWAELPAQAVTRAVADLLAASGHFRDVGNAADMARPDLLLTGELRAFHENRALDPPVAEVELRVEVRHARQAGSVWAQTVRETEPLPDPGPAAFAAAMNRAVSRVASHITREITAVPYGCPQLSEQPDNQP